jgi:3-oxoacid CoA-transferase subunit A
MLKTDKNRGGNHMDKLKSPKDAVQLIKEGDTVLVGGFGMCGTPLTLLDEITQHTSRNLTVVSNNLGEQGRGLGKLLLTGHLKKAIGTFFTTNKDAVQAWSKGELEIELIPQGTLAEAIRAGGAGIGGFYTKTAVGTKLQEGRETKVFDGETYLLQEAIKGDVAIIKAAKADKLGNLTYDKTARNFNPNMATAGKITIAEVDEIVEVGALAPDEIVTPHVYVDVVIQSEYVKVGGDYVAKTTV